MAGVTPKQIYQALLSAGASTTQAIGIMANMMAESSLNPEAINRADPNGGSFGLVQQNGSSYSSLVTGNPSADMNQQIKVLAHNGGFAAASGSTGATAAGNFAANYERCQGCQPGGAQYSTRVANANTVAGWVSSGSWPTSAGSAASSASGGAGTQATLTSYNTASCLVGTGGGILGFGSVCIFTKSEARAFIGAMVLGVSVTVGIVGAVILAASAFQKTGAARAVGQAAAVVPGVGAGVRAATRAAPRQPTAAATRQRTTAATREQRAEITRGNREARQAAGTPRNQSRARRGLAPRQQPPAAPRPTRPPPEVHH